MGPHGVKAPKEHQALLNRRDQQSRSPRLARALARTLARARARAFSFCSTICRMSASSMLGGLSRPLPSILTSYSASPKLITLPSPSRYDTPGMSFAPCIVVPVALLASVRKNLPARHASVAWRASSPAAAGSATSASSAEPPSTTSFSAVAPTAEPPPTSGTSTTTSSPVQLTCPSGGAVPAQMTRKTHAQGGRRGAETLSASHTRRTLGRLAPTSTPW